MGQLASDLPLMDSLSLGGLIHLWGEAGSGKTLFAVALACDTSKEHHVEWINADGKRSFIAFLKRNIIRSGGQMKNISVTFTESRSELCDLIRKLPEIADDASLVIIDSITRVLDMAYEDPLLWGREMIEDILPTLAGIIVQNGIDVIIISENRTMNDFGNRAVHHHSLSRWIDHDIHVTRHVNGSHSQISRTARNGKEELAIMKLDASGILEVTPRMVKSHNSKEENEIVR